MERDSIPGPSRRNSKEKVSNPSQRKFQNKYSGRQQHKLDSSGWRNNLKLKARDDGRYRGFRFNKFSILEQFAKDDICDIFTRLSKEKENFFELLNIIPNKPEVYVLIVQILAKLSISPFDHLQSMYLLRVCNSPFISNLVAYLNNFQRPQYKLENGQYLVDQIDFWENLLTFLDCVTDISPSTAKTKCRPLIEDVSKSCLEKLKEHGNFSLPDDLDKKWLELRQKIINFASNETKPHNAFVDAEVNEPPEDFRKLSVIPTSNDLMESRPFLRPNIINGAYQNVEHYLDVQFRLMREDCFGPLREGLVQFRNNPNRNKYDNIRVYRDVKFLSPYLSNMRMGSIIEVSASAKRIFRTTNWSYNKRFIFGSLILLTKDNCESFIAATVLDRDISYLKYGMIQVSIINADIGEEIYNSERYTMIESEVYFEPYKHVMKALQEPNFPKHFAMKKYIVDVDPSPAHPMYLKEDTSYISDSNETFTVLNFESWPKKEDLNLNESQYEAYKAALTHEFAVVQGPPGTGKTFLGTKIAKTLLKNVDTTNRRCKILLVCYTNHALDQFLEALIPFTDSIARIGGQSRNQSMEPFKLKNLRKKMPSGHFSDEKRVLSRTVLMYQEYQDTWNRLSTGVLKLKYLQSFDDLSRFVSTFNEISLIALRNVDPLDKWLFENIKLDFTEKVDNIENMVLKDNTREHQNERELNHDATNEFLISRSHLFFALEDSRKREIELVLAYRSEENPYKKRKLRYKLALLRARVKLFLDMQNAYISSCSEENDENVNLQMDSPNVTAMPILDRWMMYFRWKDIVQRNIKFYMVSKKEEVAKALAVYEESTLLSDYEILKNTQVIGMTTTGAAKSRKLIKALGPPIVIVEEAAEVLEQHIITSLSDACKHLILIGDHQQLRPSAAHLKLARHYNIEVSLFERMILNNVHSRRLDVQHRMRPEIAALISPHIYSDLHNHPSVHKFPNVRGFNTNIFFLSHNFQEKCEQDSKSRSNPEEADLMLGLANYIMQQGYSADELTLLTMYSGQMFYMRKQRMNYSHLSNVKITLVDNFQGEESNIILLSLVRNNEENKIGFLATENRVCVALSRAREGFYMFGNIDILRKNSKLWTTISDNLLKDGNLGASIELVCEIHRTGTEISCLEDFNKLPEGGCNLKCDYQLLCGHFCPLFCHGFDREHSAVKCVAQCERTCESMHVCPGICGNACRPCIVKMSKQLPCGHTQNANCHEDPNQVFCQTMVEVKLPACEHEVLKACSEKMANVRCSFPCEFRVDKCGHACALKCHVLEDPYHEQYKCGKPCVRSKRHCSMPQTGDLGEHGCNKLCFQDCDDCNVLVQKIRSTCKHREKIACHTNLDTVKCLKMCSRKLPCGHFCKQRCSQKCEGCDVMVDKVIPECNHKIKIKCSAEAKKDNCNNKCERNLSCGHACTGLCKEICDENKCTAVTALWHDSPCGHKVTLPCAVNKDYISDGEVRKEVLLPYCQEPCGKLLMCEHTCAGTCGDCYQDRLHVACKQRCQRINICGHECKAPCSAICPPCRNKCKVKCHHSKCNKRCGEPCTPCQERCTRSCMHGFCDRRCSEPCSRQVCTERCPKLLECGHACRGVCGEPCPPVLCKICRPDEFPRDFLGDEFSEDSMFILLKDCGHVMELEDMNNLMNCNQDTVAVKTCPLCREPIVNTERYKDLIEDLFKTQINPVKEKVNGTSSEIKKTRLQLRENAQMIKLDLELNSDTTIPKIQQTIMKTLRKVTEIIDSNKRCDKMELHAYCVYLDILDILWNSYKDYDSIIALEGLKKFKSELLKQILMICNYLNNNLSNLSQQQQHDLDKELKRLNAIVNLSKIVCRVPLGLDLKKVDEAENDAKLTVFDWRVFDEDKTIRALKQFQATIKIVGTLITERKMIVKAMNLKSGAWYKCPNGHFYCIGDCGGAVLKSQCPECKEEIGGENHALLASNSHAPEFDNSTFPAYSEEYNNMANFNLNFD